jgi:hypothetical protein
VIVSQRQSPLDRAPLPEYRYAQTWSAKRSLIAGTAGRQRFRPTRRARGAQIPRLCAPRLLQRRGCSERHLRLGNAPLIVQGVLVDALDLPSVDLSRAPGTAEIRRRSRRPRRPAEAVGENQTGGCWRSSQREDVMRSSSRAAGGVRVGRSYQTPRNRYNPAHRSLITRKRRARALVIRTDGA